MGSTRHSDFMSILHLGIDNFIEKRNKDNPTLSNEDVDLLDELYSYFNNLNLKNKKLEDKS